MSSSKKHTPSFILLSAMYENGGNTTHRFLDGHPELFVYPFESQLGTKYVDDYLSSVFPAKYRWPIFPNSMNLDQLYEAIIDEEFKVRVKTPNVSKFRDKKFDVTDVQRKESFKKYLAKKQISRRTIIEAFFHSTFATWKDVHNKKTGSTYVGYSPVVGIDGEQIINDFGDDGVVLHIVRNPFSAYADTKKRAVPLSLEHYLYGWITCQYYARLYAQKFPKSFYILRYEDIIQDPNKVLGGWLEKLGFAQSKSLSTPTWNGEEMHSVYPWGTIRTPNPEVNLKTAQELSPEEIQSIFDRALGYIKYFDFMDFYTTLKK